MSRFQPGERRHGDYRWDDAATSGVDPVELLVYRSNLLGSDPRITNTGGGNTSSKTTGRDPLTGREVEVLWVKGSGGDLRTSTAENFSSLYLDKLLALRDTYENSDPRGPKSAAEDAMVALYPHCTFNLNPRAPSIDTPLHAFVPHAHVDHLHPNNFIAISACANSERVQREVFGDDIVYTPWQRPGFDLGLHLADLCAQNPSAVGVNLGQHGVISWADDAKECYELSLDLIERAGRYIEGHDKGEATFGGEKYGSIDPANARALTCELLPWLRGQLSTGGHAIATVQAGPETLRFVNSHDAPRLAALGTSCPDHFLRTKLKPLFIDWDPSTGDLAALRSRIADGLVRYREEYAAYYYAHHRPGSPPMRDPNPTVVLIPGLGMLAWGKNKGESRTTAEFYNCAIEVMRGAEAIDSYVALPPQEAFDIEYWALEEAKLRRMPPEREFERKVVVVVGAGSGIGKAVAEAMLEAGAHLACADLIQDAAESTACELAAKAGPAAGVAGTGLSGSGRTIALPVDVTDRQSIRRLLEDVTYAYGGFDHIALTAGIFVPPDTSGQIPDDRWATTFAINTTGVYLVGDEAKRIFDDQGLEASIVVTTSANAVVSKRGSLAYDASKAAANHLVRGLAIELAPLVRVNAVAPATVIAGSAMFPRDRVIASLAKYGIAYSDDETTEALRDRLAGFYAQRTLTKRPVTTADQAAAVRFLLSDASAKTTGQVLAVDGGLHEAFLR